jgi:hypothetical protein
MGRIILELFRGVNFEPNRFFDEAVLFSFVDQKILINHKK